MAKEKNETTGVNWAEIPAHVVRVWVVSGAVYFSAQNGAEIIERPKAAAPEKIK